MRPRANYEHLRRKALERFKAMDRRWTLIIERGHGSTKAANARTFAYLRMATAAERAAVREYHEPPKLTHVGNMFDLLARVSHPEDRPLVRRVLPDGRIVEVWRMFYNNRITVTSPQNDGISWDEAYCYKDRALAVRVAETWDGEDEPAGWNKNLQTGEWREHPEDLERGGAAAR